MKKLQSFALRFLGGLFVLAVLVYGLFALTLAAIPTWGAAPEEVRLSLPGDEINDRPNILWTNAITIAAPPEQVWPWIAQLGDSRGAFYSYTFIENQVGALTGAADYKVTYTNADRIHPEWQNPQAGEALIQGMLKVHSYETGRYLLADSIQPAPFMWVWGWHLQPAQDGAATRLLVRFSIQVPPSMGDNPVMNFVLSAGGFVMQQNMLQGIQLRAAGGAEPAWTEALEIVLWLAALVCGLAAGWLYLGRRAWRGPLAVACLAVIVLFVLTFVQPPLLLRFGLDAALAGAVVWSGRS